MRIRDWSSDVCSSDLADYQGQHPAFAWREVEIPSPQHPQFSARRSHFPVLRNRRLDRDHQIGVAERFRQAVDCTALDRADRTRHVTMACDKYNMRMLRFCDLLLQLDAVVVYQFDI